MKHFPTKITFTTAADLEVKRMWSVLTEIEKMKFAEDLKKEYKLLLSVDHSLMNTGDLLRVYHNRKKYE